MADIKNIKESRVFRIILIATLLGIMFPMLESNISFSTGCSGSV